MRSARLRMPAFLFDLDGTLLDSKGDLADAANAARAAAGLPPLPDAEVELHIGRGMAALLAGVVPNADAGTMEVARARFIDHYKANLVVRSRPYPSVDRMFRALGGHPLGVVTNKPAMFTEPILDQLAWRDRFQVVVCGDTTPERKPSAGPLLHAIRGLGLSESDCVFVGDTAIDRDTAANAGVRFVCVSWGRGASGCERVVSELDSLVDLFPEG